MTWGCVTDRFPKIQSGLLIEMPQNCVLDVFTEFWRKIFLLPLRRCKNVQNYILMTKYWFLKEPQFRLFYNILDTSRICTSLLGLNIESFSFSRKVIKRGEIFALPSTATFFQYAFCLLLHFHYQINEICAIHDIFCWKLFPKKNKYALRQVTQKVLI